LSVLLLFSCWPPPSYETIEWQTDGDGFVQYSTNDPRYIDTIQYLPLAVESESPMTTVTATVKKVSGAGQVGFGIVYCYEDENNHYRLLITTGGYYQVGEMVGGTFTALVSWTASADLNTGLGAMNDISITRDVGGNFTVTFNGQYITDFTNGNFPGGQAGPCIGIGSSSLEQFPSIPEDARFKMLAPAVYPP
ncbi:MAG: hypothetical protein NTU62_13480, partial [Spirochaetes bacterium]|nr:hypothetical protein [Spirochaetota bacterium]